MREKEAAELKTEARELAVMRKEDKRSLYAHQYFIECEIAEISAHLAKVRADELNKYRHEEAVKRVEDQMARSRAERVEKRRKEAEALLKTMEREELVLQGTH